MLSPVRPKLTLSSILGVFWTGGSLNPARSFAPAVAIAEFHSTQWIYWVGPFAGSVLAVLLYRLIKALEYETANPDPEAPQSNNAKQAMDVEKMAMSPTGHAANDKVA